MRHNMFRNLPIAVAVAGVLLIAMPPSVSAQTAGKTMTTPSGLQITDSTVGTGATPKPGQICVMHYTGWLYEGGWLNRRLNAKGPSLTDSARLRARRALQITNE